MNPSSSVRQQLVLWSLVLGLWLLLVLAFAGQLFFTGNVPWSEAVVISLRDWYPWLLFGPIVVWLALRFPLERDRWQVSIPVHILGCAAAVLLYGLMVPRGPAGRPLSGGPASRFRGARSNARLSLRKTGRREPDRRGAANCRRKAR